MNYWLGTSTGTTYRLEGSPSAEKSVYLTTFRNIKGEDDWHKWFMQHIYDAKGYPGIRQLIEKLKAHEEGHNSRVESLIQTLKKEIRLSLKDLPELEEWKSTRTKDCYYMRNICLAVIDDRPLTIFDQKDLFIADDNKIATSDNETLTRLKTAIEGVRLAHKEDFLNMQHDIEEDRQILEKIQEHIKEILYDLALEKPLKGECDYERSLDK